MKRSISLFLSLAMMLTLVACGGSKDPAPSAPSGTGSAASTDASAGAAGPSVDGDFIMATGGTSGTYYPYGGMVAQAFNKNTGSNITANATGASVENLRLLNAKEADLALCQTDTMTYAIEGGNDFFEKPLGTIRSIAALHPEVIHVVTTDLSLNNVSELKGKVVAVGAAGSGIECNARHVLAAYGMD